MDEYINIAAELIQGVVKSDPEGRWVRNIGINDISGIRNRTIWFRLADGDASAAVVFQQVKRGLADATGTAQDEGGTIVERTRRGRVQGDVVRVEMQSGFNFENDFNFNRDIAGQAAHPNG